MNDRELTQRLAEAALVSIDPSSLATLFSFTPEMTEWSLNPRGDRRGDLRISVWTRDRTAAARVLESIAPNVRPLRDSLLPSVGHEGLGLALRDQAAPTGRWWALAGEEVELAAAFARAFPDDRSELEALFEAAGGANTCVAVGVEHGGSPQRRTIYSDLRTPMAALRVLELARVTVSKQANLFFKGICGLEPDGRPWPRVWAGRSLGDGGGWKFYYCARDDDHRRSDEVLLDAIDAGPHLKAAWQVLRDASSGPVIQFIALTCRDDAPPAFTAYLARS